MDIEMYNGDGPIRLGAQIGYGRMGEVYKVLVDGEEMAVKIYKHYSAAPKPVADAMGRSISAGKSLSGLPPGPLSIAPGTAPVLARDQGQEYPGILMPLAEGISCGDWLTSRPDEQQKLDLLFRLLTGLATLHRHGVAHNDLSFGNIVVGKRLWLLDFDRAGEAPPNLTHDSVFYKREGSGPAHDLRAFGILAMIVIEGRHPWTDELSRLAMGEIGFGAELHLPDDPGWSRLLQPALELVPGLQAHDLLAAWPNRDH